LKVISFLFIIVRMKKNPQSPSEKVPLSNPYKDVGRRLAYGSRLTEVDRKEIADIINIILDDVQMAEISAKSPEKNTHRFGAQEVCLWAHVYFETHERNPQKVTPNMLTFRPVFDNVRLIGRILKEFQTHLVIRSAGSYMGSHLWSTQC